jgi:serine/threonine protein kinase
LFDMHPPIVLPRLSPGEIVAGKYRVIGALGAGGFGQVFGAEHVKLGTRVAIKVQTRAGPAASAWREARAAARLRSPHTVRIFDVDELPDGSPYIVMEFLEGVSLRQYLQEHQQVPWQRALRWTRELCAALEEAHAAGLVHRDIKPSNIFLLGDVDESRSVKLLDFGLARALDGSTEQSRSDSSASFAGSPAYMSPEQVRGMAATTASDIWSLGVLLYEMLGGRRPFTGDGPPALFAAVVSDQPTPLLEVAPHIPERLGLVVARCLRKAPCERPASVEALERELSCLIGGIDPAVAGDETKSGLTALPNAGDRTRRSRLALAALAAVAIFGSLSLALRSPLAERSGPEGHPTSAAAFPLQRPEPQPEALPKAAAAAAPSVVERAEPAPASSSRPTTPLNSGNAPHRGFAPPPTEPARRDQPVQAPPVSDATSPTFFDEPDF